MPIQIYLAIGLVVALISSTSSWYFTRMYYVNQILETQQKASEALLEASNNYIKAMKQGEEQYAENQAIINDLNNKLSSRVRIHIPTCPSPTSTEDQDGRSRVFSEGVDKSFGQFEQRIDELVKRCDQLNIDAIKSNEVSN